LSAVGRLARWLGGPLARVPRATGADAIVVLGAPLRPDGSLSNVLAERVAAGVALFHAGCAPLLVMTGGRGTWIREHAQPASEASAMAAAAEEAGVPPGALIREETSSNTSRNAFATRDCLAGRGVSRIIIVSQPFHLRRALLWFRRAGFEASGHVIEAGLQERDPRRALRWIAKEYVSLVRDLTLTRRPGG
jgi:uncharacterized SAM-binding protein YcdF (DUF218 family)